MKHMGIFLGVSSLVGALSANLYAATNSSQVTYGGTLVAEPCEIVPEFENFSVEFNSISTKELYSNSRILSKEFELQLKDCDASIANSVTTIFNGNATPDGLLEFDANSEASGAAIGIETLSGVKLPLNPTSGVSYPSQPIKNGAMTIRLRAYLQGKARAIANNSIKPGNFSATMTYTLSYQ